MSGEKSAAYRCVISPENSAGELRMGRKSYPIFVLDTSRDGFTAKIPTRLVASIQASKTCQLKFSGELWEVSCNGVYSEATDNSEVDFLRVRELTKIKQPRFGGPGVSLFSPQQDPTLLLGLMIGFLIACICLPGIGDQIGTAPKVSRAVKSWWEKFESTVIP
jgi:hypothetical protein